MSYHINLLFVFCKVLGWSLIFWKTNKEPTENPEPFCSQTSVHNDVSELSRAWDWKYLLSFERAILIQAISECVYDRNEFLVPPRFPCLWSRTRIFSFISNKFQTSGEDSLSKAASFRKDCIYLDMGFLRAAPCIRRSWYGQDYSLWWGFSHWRMFSNISGLYPPGISATP